MSTRYKVVGRSFMTLWEKSKAMEEDLNRLSRAGWELVAVDPVTFLGFDIGYNLIFRSDTKHATGSE